MMEIYNLFNIDNGWILIIDLLLLLLVPYIFLKNWYRTIVFFIGFLLTQISMPRTGILPYVELGLEIAGIITMITTCMGTRQEKKIRGTIKWF